MKTGFSHFDGSGRENFCAAVLLLAMEVDEAVKELVARLVREKLDLERERELLSFGREARLHGDEGVSDEQAEKQKRTAARSDLWMLLGPLAQAGYALVEIKTHNGWDADDVARQVMDQAKRKVTRGADLPVLGSVLLGPERLCRKAEAADARVRVIPWPRLFSELRSLRSTSPLTELAIRHLEEKMDRPHGLNRSMSLDQFEAATTTIACLREFLIACIEDIGGSVQGDPMWLTPGDGQPRRGGGWAWRGLSVPFSREGKKGRVGIYKYSEAPTGEERAKTTLWLEAYLADGDDAKAFLEFTPPSLSTEDLDAVRTRFVALCLPHLPALSAEASTT